MATTKAEPKPATASTKAVNKTYEGLTREDLLRAYRLMYLSRRIDDREILLKRQQRVFFQISGAGHEAMLVAAGLLLKPGYDWFFPYYRDRALCLALGMTAEEMLLGAVGAAADPNSGGRQMPSHWGHKGLNIVTGSSPTGSQILHAVGCAEAGRLFNAHPDSAAKAEGDYREFKDVVFHGDEVSYVSCGDGTTSQGEFWEALSSASNNKLPVLFVVEDNGYAISTPVEVNTPGGNISKVVSGFPNFHFEECDGTEVLESYRAFKRAIDYIRAGKGPAFVHGHVIRPYSHSLSDDEKLYRPEAERKDEANRDPITKFYKWLVAESLATDKELKDLQTDVDTEVQDSSDRAVEAPIPALDSYSQHLYSSTLDPASAAFETRPQFPVHVEGETAVAPAKTMADLINACLKDEMKRDPRIVIFGEDVADCSREEYLKQKQVKGKGGVFKLTSGLQMEYGADRVFNSPLAEANIVGRATGMAVRGLKPVVEIQFFDYIWPAMHQLRNELPVVRWRSNGAFSSPAVIRVAIGGYLTGGAIYHSQCGESIFTHTPGMRVIFPSNALDANGLLRTAIRCDDPVLFLEHKRLYRETFGRSPYPGPDYMVPFGKAKIVKAGHDITVVTYGAVVPRALQAAQKIERENGVSVELIDLRTLNPYDFEAIAESIHKTNRVIVAHEDTLSWGYGAEIAARIADELFDELDAPVKRVAAKDTFVAYQPALEDVILPQSDDLFAAMLEMSKY
ncbi:dehydrogenase, E1 component [Candidatus Koribacter versatilis Ellin345]|uniref:Dehydrogenase, E1 component n=1 Tax=Koribacter versatilis (strain Ellin345) TaxID=204669 RepID=Q1IQR3_KORVE|nr:dehydrogenase E1 component subunit alpha/beta [Candidatus Koribacter versatilis]ABF40787.1 dehydrogenase, E1 component [Candidatus Koribacter versatilis Ellin345]